MEEWPTNLDMTSLDAVVQTLEDVPGLETNNERVLRPKTNDARAPGRLRSCARQHLRNNTTCSMWLAGLLRQDFGVLPTRRKQKSGVAADFVDTRRHHRVTKETYIRA